MPESIDARLQKLGIVLPDVPAPVANYAPFVVTGDLVFISGQICKAEGELKYAGKLGSDLTTEAGQAAARLCAINVLAALKQACGGDLSRVSRCVRLGIYVNSVDEFTDQSLVANGASDLVVEVFGDAGRHARAAVSSNSLPVNTAVEVEGLFELA